MTIFKDPFFGVESIYQDNHTYHIECILTHNKFSCVRIRVTDGAWVTEHEFDRFALMEQDRQAFKKHLVELHHKMRADHPDYRHPGPTNQEIRENIALSNAWQEFQMIYKLTKGP